MIRQAQGRPKKVYLVGARPEPARVLERLGGFNLLAVDDHQFRGSMH